MKVVGYAWLTIGTAPARVPVPVALAHALIFQSFITTTAALGFAPTPAASVAVEVGPGFGEARADASVVHALPVTRTRGTNVVGGARKAHGTHVAAPPVHVVLMIVTDAVVTNRTLVPGVADARAVLGAVAVARARQHSTGGLRRDGGSHLTRARGT